MCSVLPTVKVRTDYISVSGVVNEFQFQVLVHFGIGRVASI